MIVSEAVDTMLKVFTDAWIAHGCNISHVRWTDVAGNIPTSPVVWARVTVRHADGFKRVLGNGPTSHSNTGTLWVQVFAPIGSGNTQAYAAAQHVVTAFRNSKNTDVWFRNARMKEVGTSGAFEQINVLVDFTYDN